MPEATMVPPASRAELLINSPGSPGRSVVRNLRMGESHVLGEQESFLMVHCDGRRDARSIRAAFEARFGEPRGADDLREFLDLARDRHLLRTAE